jgi:hypothetical protein
VVTAQPAVQSTTAAGFSGSVNPEGLPTTAHFEYGLDQSLRATPGPTYDQRTPDQSVGSDFAAHQVTATVSNLVPNALYHARLVATNSAGTTFGPDQTFRTKKDPPPPPPVLGKTENAVPVSGIVFIKPPPGKSLGKAGDILARAALVKGQGFLALTEARQIPAGSKIDARSGSLQVVAAGPLVGKTQSAVLGGALFGLAQERAGVQKGLTTLSLLEGDFAGAPSYASCRAHAADDPMSPNANAAVSPRVLQTLHASANHARFRTRGRYSAATVRGTVWDTIDRCDGTLTVVHRGTVQVTDFGRRKTITIHAGHSYLARAIKH